MNTNAANAVVVECLAEDAGMRDGLCTTFFMAELVKPKMPPSAPKAAQETDEFLRAIQSTCRRVHSCTQFCAIPSSDLLLYPNNGRSGELPGVWSREALLVWGACHDMSIKDAYATRTDDSGRQWQHTIY